LNFDYGLKTEYHQIVIQLKENFLSDAFNETPELQQIRQLFDKASLGLSFHGKTKVTVANKLQKMHQLNYFTKPLALVATLQLLATSTQVTDLTVTAPNINLF